MRVNVGTGKGKGAYECFGSTGVFIRRCPKVGICVVFMCVDVDVGTGKGACTCLGSTGVFIRR